MAVGTDWNKIKVIDAEEPKKSSKSWRLTELQLKVKKTIERLSIPAWYLNKYSKPPKLVNDVPIEQRVPAWKSGTYKKIKSAMSLPRRNTKSVIIDENKSTSAPVPKALKESKKSISTSTLSTVPISDKQHASNKNVALFLPSNIWDSKLLDRKVKGGTFPRMSVPKRANNIEIFLPLEADLDLTIDRNPDMKIVEISDRSRTAEITNLDDYLDPEYVKSRATLKQTLKEIEAEESENMCDVTIGNKYKDQSKDNCENELPIRKTLEMAMPESLKWRACSTPQEGSVPKFSSPNLESPISKPIGHQVSPQCIQKLTITSQVSSSLAESPQKKIIRKPIYILPHWRPFHTMPRLSEPTSNEFKRCDNRKAKNGGLPKVAVPDEQRPSASSSVCNPLLPMPKDNPSVPISRHSPNIVSSAGFLISKHKSITLERIIRQKRNSQKSYVKGLIQQFEQKHEPSSNAFYPSPGEKGNVMKMVKALERRNADDGNWVQNSINTETKSLDSSITSSAKESESASDCERKSPSICSEPDYEWTVSMKHEAQKLKAYEQRKEVQNDSVFWFPVQKLLPKTNSLWNRKASPDRVSPTTSPIKAQETSFRTPERSECYIEKDDIPNKLFNEPLTRDSGYSDRSIWSFNIGSPLADFEHVSGNCHSFGGSLTRSTRARRNIVFGDSMLDYNYEKYQMVRKSASGGINSIGKGGVSMPSNEECGIRDVWAHNLEEEFRTIRQVVQQYQYIAMDTEFPGVVARPIGEFRTSADYQYQLLRCNVDLLRIIQLGLTFLDESGTTPGGTCTTWQFNFKFNLQEDMYAQDSIDMLQNSGIQFKKHEEEGIDPLDFAELLMTSGIVLADDIKWLSFHSGYDFGYLLKLLTDQNLPHEESEFFELLRIYFPTIYDVKYLMKSCKNLKGGLQEVAEQLELQRVGPQHQAGSDSLLTGMVFFKMREMFFEDNIDDAKYCGHLYGLGTSFVVNGSGGYLDSNGDNSSSS